MLCLDFHPSYASSICQCAYVCICAFVCVLACMFVFSPLCSCVRTIIAFTWGGLGTEGYLSWFHLLDSLLSFLVDFSFCCIQDHQPHPACTLLLSLLASLKLWSAFCVQVWPRFQFAVTLEWMFLCVLESSTTLRKCAICFSYCSCVSTSLLLSFSLSASVWVYVSLRLCYCLHLRWCVCVCEFVCKR